MPPAEEQSYDYRENADGSLTITGYRGAESSLEIPAVLEGRPVTGIGEGCFAGALCLRKVRVPEGVEQIGDYAFECCSALRKIYLPDSLRAIGTEFSDPIMISTTTDPGIAANFGDTLFVIYASQEAMEGLGAICVDAVVHSAEREILMNANAQYVLIVFPAQLSIGVQNDLRRVRGGVFRDVGVQVRGYGFRVLGQGVHVLPECADRLEHILLLIAGHAGP